MNFRRLFILSAFAALSAGCVQENPTAVGDVLLPGGNVVSFEVVLPASQFLVQDTSFSGYTNAPAANYSLVANKFEGVTDANTLFRFSILPSTIAVKNSAGVAVVDSFPRFVSGQLVLHFDTVSVSGRPLRLHAYRTVEPWDISATWALRIDSGTVHLPWQTAGGSRGASIDTATWVTGDSLVLKVDSTTIRQWQDTANNARGAIIVGETPNTRVRIVGTTLHVTTKSSINADTTLTLDLVPTVRTFVFNPTPPKSAGGLRVGGVPSWRGFLQMRNDLRTLTFPCSSTQTCTVPLDSTHLTSAELLLNPVRPPLGFSPEDTMFVELRSVPVSSAVPIERSPSGVRYGLSAPIPPSTFLTAQTKPLSINITQFMQNLLDPNVKDTDRLAPYLALIQVPDAATSGFGMFDAKPSLRLIVTTALEKK